MIKKSPLLLFLTFLSIETSNIYAQSCNFLDTAIQTPISLDCPNGTSNRSGVAWNPAEDLYYSCNAGADTYPFETFSSAGGAAISTSTGGISWRGLWWNPTLNQVEGNAHSTTGWYKKDLDANGYALSTNTNIFPGQNQPNVQSCGDLDYDANEVIFYDAGSIFRYDRSTGAAISNYTLNNMPAGTLSSYTAIYTGCVGNEIGVYDYSNQRLLLFDKSTGDFSTSVQLPSTAPAIINFNMSYANDLFWLFDINASTWHSFEIFVNCTDNVTDTQTACGSYTWIDGITYTASNNTAMDTLQNVAGCDSIITLNLTINPFPDNDVTQTGAMLTADENGAQYQWLDCDNALALLNGETSQSYTPVVTGNYAVEITANGCSDTSACYLVDYTGISEYYKGVISIHPNPANNVLYIDGDHLSSIKQVVVTSTSGEILLNVDKIGNELDISKLEPGVYFIHFSHILSEEIIKFIKL